MSKVETMLDLDALGFVGADLNRPECVLCHASGRLFASDWTEGGGVCVIEPDGRMHRILARQKNGDRLRPNGIALLPGGAFLLAHLGRSDGGLWRLEPDGSCSVVLGEIEGHPLPPTNFVYREPSGRLWITVSTRLRPRNLAYRPDVEDGFIIVMDEQGARIAADGLGFTNECFVDPSGEKLYVNETFARRLSVFDIGPGGGLSNKTLVAEFGVGSYPDGLTLDAEGGLWVTSIVSNRLIRIHRDGRQEIMLEDADAEHVAWVEEAFQAKKLGRPHLDTVRSQRLQSVSSLAFGGQDLKIGYLGSLLGDRVARIPLPVAGHPPPHWQYDLGPIAAPPPDRLAAAAQPEQTSMGSL